MDKLYEGHKVRKDPTLDYIESELGLKADTAQYLYQMTKLNHLDLFSGIGGFSLGLEATGYFETVAFCDFDPYCQKVLRKHWPWVTIYDDVKELNSERLSANGHTKIDIITGGYPCQPFSIAGRQKGEQDPRHVWPEMFRLVKELRPTWVIGENKSGHIKLGLDTVLENWRVKVTPQERLVFQLRASVQTTKEKGSGYWRTRMPQHEGTLFGSQDEMKLKKNAHQFERPSQTSKSDVANTCGSATWQRRQKTYRAEEHRGKLEEKVAMMPTPTARDWRDAGPNELRESQEEGQIGWSQWWQSEPNVGRVAHGVPKRVDRLKSLGNSLVPMIPYYIGMSIKKGDMLWTNRVEHTTSIESIKAFREAQSPVFKTFGWCVWQSIIKSIIKNEDGVPYDSKTRN